MKRKLYIVPVSPNTNLYNIPDYGNTIYGDTVLEVDDSKRKYIIDNVTKQYGRAFAVIDDNYYNLPPSKSRLNDEEIKADKSIKKFTKEDMDSLLNNTYMDFTIQSENDEIEEIIATVVVTGGDISGTVNSAITKDITVTITNDTFKGISNGASVNEWVVDNNGTPCLPTGLTAQVSSELTSGNREFTINISGTASTETSTQAYIKVPASNTTETETELLSNPINITISASAVEEQQDTAPATITISGDVAGQQGSEITGEIVVTLTGDTFTGLTTGNDVLSMIVNGDNTAVLNDKGLTAVVKEDPTSNNTVLTITIGGTPNTEMNEDLYIKIPGSNLTNGEEIKSNNTINFSVTSSARSIDEDRPKKGRQK